MSLDLLCFIQNVQHARRSKLQFCSEIIAGISEEIHELLLQLWRLIHFLGKAIADNIALTF